MSETKHEIPAPMLDAATAAVFNKNYCSEWAAGKLAEVALEAADVAKMAADRERIGMALFQNGYDSGWTTDSAVEAIEAMAAELETLQKGIVDFRPEDVLARESELLDRAERAEARIGELEADSRRLRFLMTGSGIDGFYGVVNDRYDFATQIAYERGHDEPTPDDEFDGWRRLIDAAMIAPSGAGDK